MRNKFTVFFLALCILSCLFVLSSCSNEVDFELQLVDGDMSSNEIQKTYYYGESLDVFDNLAYMIIYTDGNVENITEGVTLSYTYKEETKTTINSSSVLDVGVYVITYSYSDRTATLILTIESVSSIQDVDISLIDTTTSLASSSFKFAELYNTKSNYNFVVKDSDGVELQSEEIIGIYALTEEEKDEYLLITDDVDQQLYLENHKGDSISDIDLSLIQDALDPGDYYLYVSIANRGNYNASFSSPSLKITVEKGDLVLSSEDIDSFGIYAEYRFSNETNNKFNTFDEEGNTIEKALTLNDLQPSLAFGNSTSETWIEVPGGTISVFVLGHFEFINLDAPIDCSDNGTSALAKFVIDDEYYSKRYAIVGDNEYSIDLNIYQASVSMFYRGKSYTYNGQEQYFAGTDEQCNDDIVALGYDSSIINAKDIMQTNAGDYNPNFALKDDVNYAWNADFLSAIEDKAAYVNGAITFGWNIAKLSTNSAGYEVNYNGEKVDSNVITYIDGQTEVKIAIKDSQYSNYLGLRNDGATTFFWTFDSTSPINNMEAYISEGNVIGLSNTLVLSSIDSVSSYVNIVVTCNESINFDAFKLQITLYFNPRALSEEEMKALNDAVPFTTTEGSYSADNSIAVSYADGKYYIPDNAIPAETANGSWQLQYEENGEVFSYGNGSEIGSDYLSKNWYYIYIPTDRCCESIKIFVNLDESV